MSVANPDFPPCAICGADSWSAVHRGPIRDGAFGAWRNAEVCRCGDCGVDRVAESVCLQIDAYRSPEYRQRLQQDHDIDRHYAAHDELAKFTLDALWPISLRGKVIADVGCGGGVLLDHVRGITSSIVAIEPAEPFARSLRERGYAYFPSAAQAASEYANRVDVVLSTQVIEHVDDPRAFLDDIRDLLKPDGVALVSTPNRRDVLMDLLPEDFPKFFYRVQHRWAFDAVSLSACAARAGLAVLETKHIHRYGMANTMHWMKERRPCGRTPMAPLDGAMDKLWQSWLEGTGRSDNLYVLLRRADARAG